MDSAATMSVGRFEFLDSRDSPVNGVSQILTIFLILLITHNLLKFRNFLDLMLILTKDLASGNMRPDMIMNNLNVDKYEEYALTLLK